MPYIQLKPTPLRERASILFVERAGEVTEREHWHWVAQKNAKIVREWRGIAGALIEKNRFNRERADHKPEARAAGGKRY